MIKIYFSLLIHIFTNEIYFYYSKQILKLAQKILD